MADDFSATRYVRLDPAGHDKKTVLVDIKTSLSMKMPAICGWDVYQSIYNVGTNGNVPYPTSGESIIGGHATLCAGYDDAHVNSGTVNKGAFLIKNSWGTNWGIKGYCWLPYDYLLNNHADDWWTLVTTKWTDVDKFSEANG
jgi:C1A family cysteine protease